MITGERKRLVDKIWDALWTAGITRPVTQATFAELKEML